MSARQDAYIAELVLSQPEVIAGLFVGCLGIGTAALFLARRLGWRPVPAALAGCGLALALAVTLGRPGVLDAGVLTTDPIGWCVANEFSLTGSLQRLNLLMLVPFAFFATIATGRPVVVLALSAGLSGTVELVQATTGLGVCEAQDFANNTVGATFAVLVAWLITLLVTAVTGSARTERGDRPARDPATTR
ncbi:VanZ family protein [Saccharothrix sp. NPDC042600]|uniref:VanZ family protein n=1 Tax=Saccharothrix TaxID=2071 RepID=UPI0033F1EF30